MRNYWGYRIDVRSQDRRTFLYNEAKLNKLRQGWGWDNSQDLRKPNPDKRNKAIYDKVQKGDILIVPRLPSWDDVLILEATADFKEGYSFSIDETFNDYGHIFPVKVLKSFNRHNANVDANIRTTLKCYSRFWSVNHCAQSIDSLLNNDNDSLSTNISKVEIFESTVLDLFNNFFDSKKFSQELYSSIKERFESSEWEGVLASGLQRIMPYAFVEKKGGIMEKHHGTDILVKIPGYFNDYYAIAIQVKNYNGNFSSHAINQIGKAEWFTKQVENIKIIDKIVVVIGDNLSCDDSVLETAKQHNVTIIYEQEKVEELFLNIANSMIGLDKSIVL